MALTPSATALLRALLAAYRPYVRRALAERGIEIDAEVETSLAVGEEWLREDLGRLLALPWDRQHRSPLEVVQEAMRFPTDTLRRSGVPPVARDAEAMRILPDDHYALAPGSSQDLGESAWEAHLGWGAAKARALAPPEASPPPGVVLVSGNLMDGSAIEPVVRASGLVPETVGAAGEFDGIRVKPLLVLVDLVHPDADDAIRHFAPSARVIAFGPHVDDLAMARARALGAAEAIPRSRFFRRLPELLPYRT